MALVVALVSMSVGWGNVAGAQSTSETNDDLERTAREREEASRTLEELEATNDQLDAEIAALDAEILAALERLALAVEHLGWAREHARRTESELASTSGRVRVVDEGIDQGAVAAYVRPPSHALGSLLLAEDADDASRRLTLITTVLDARRSELDRLRDERDHRAARAEAARDIVTLAEEAHEAVVAAREDLDRAVAHRRAAAEELAERIEEFRAEVDALADEEERLRRLLARLEAEAARAAGLAPSSLIWPAAGVVTSEFGPRWGRRHLGIDIGAPTGTRVSAAAKGRVVMAAPFGSFGNLISIDHGGGIVTLYAHLDTIGVRVGQSVVAGERIGTIGSTGRSTGPHLHFEVRDFSTAIDPRRMLR